MRSRLALRDAGRAADDVATIKPSQRTQLEKLDTSNLGQLYGRALYAAAAAAAPAPLSRRMDSAGCSERCSSAPEQSGKGAIDGFEVLPNTGGERRPRREALEMAMRDMQAAGEVFVAAALEFLCTRLQAEEKEKERRGEATWRAASLMEQMLRSRRGRGSKKDAAHAAAAVTFPGRADETCDAVARTWRKLKTPEGREKFVAVKAALMQAASVELARISATRAKPSRVKRSGKK